MENFNQIESDILNKIQNINDRSSYEAIKTEIFGKKGIITELFKKIGSLDQNQKKEYASKLNSIKTKINRTNNMILNHQYLKQKILKMKKIC